MCCPSNKVIKSNTITFLALGGLHEDKLCNTLQVVAPTNVKTVHQTSLLHIESNLNRLRLLSPTHGQRFQQQSGQITFQDHTSHRNKENWNTEVHGGGGLGLVKPARGPASSRLKPCASLKNASRILPVRRSLVALVGRKQTVVRDQLFPQKPPGSGLVFWSRDVGSAVPPRVAPPIFPSRSESGAY